VLAIHANAICGSDRHQWDEGSDVVPGHEAAGVVIAAATESEADIDALITG
jgi:threonine 3-dehydrogenase